MPESLTMPITEVIAKENESFGLIYPAMGLREFDVYFFQVARRYPLHRTYDEEMAEIAAGGTVDFNYLGEDGLGAGANILTVWEQRPFRILHFAVGIRPDEIWLYKQQPPGVPQTGFAYEVPTKVGDKKDYIPGYLTDYDSPTVATESVIHNKMTIHYGFKNDAARPVRPSLRILGAGYDAIQITAESLINRFLTRELACRMVTVGGLSPFTYTTPDVWQPPTRVSAEKITALLGGVLAGVR